ncbi:MAG: tRNA guanosine(15) transglycosylase TgtA [Thermoplasmata archaeon]
MVVFEVVERDGLARRGRFDTPHGTIETPALLPVVHPDPERQPVPPSEMRARLGLRAVITSAYITWRTPPLRALAEREGIHGLLRFDGPVMTDSGAFQQHAYGSVEVGPEEILSFQRTIGSDIATVLDRFTEPDASPEEAEAALTTTLERAATARAYHSGLLAVPVQGGMHDALRARSAAGASALADVLAVGGVVPLFEQYRFRDLARVLAAARPHLDPGRPLHLFGTGHPMTFAFAALWGVDLLDSSAYLKFARRGSLLFPEGTVALDDLREDVCRCFLCAEHPLTEVARLPAGERERRVAYHNLLVSAEEIGRVRQAIRDGVLWELAERRASGHPALRAGLDEAKRHPDVFLPTEPASRRAFREIGPESRDRPAVVRFRRRAEEFGRDRPLPEPISRVPLRPDYLARVPTHDRSGREIAWHCATPLGLVPLELTDLYPVGPYLGIDEFARDARHRPPSDIRRELGERSGLDVDLDRDWSREWTRRQVRALLSWQYGPVVAGAIAPELVGERSRRTGRLRGIGAEGKPLFVVGTDGLPRPTFFGARFLLPHLAEGRAQVVVADDASPFVARGRSLFTRFVARADPALAPDESAVLVNRAEELLGVGRLVLAPHEMARVARGVAVRVTAHAAAPVPEEGLGEPGGTDGPAGPTVDR